MPSKYHIGVTGRNTDGGELWTERRTVRSRADLLGAVAGVASDIRTTLGDTAMGGRPNETEFVTTRSLEALQNYTAGQELYAIGKFDDAVKQYQTSIAQDPQFGRAYAGLANALFYMGRKTDAERNWQTALSLMDQIRNGKNIVHKAHISSVLSELRESHRHIRNADQAISNRLIGPEQPSNCLFHGVELSQGA